MTLPRRTFLHLAAGAATLPALPRLASAQTYPTRPVRIVVGYAAGGGNDIFARLIGQWLSEHLSQPFVVENRPGAGTNLAVEYVVHSAPDGYTLLLVDSAATLNSLLNPSLGFNFIRDTEPVSGIAVSAIAMVVNPSVPATSVPEFIAYAKAHADAVTFATPGNGSLNHVAGELFNQMANVHMVPVHYRGAAPALTDVLGGHVQVMFPSLASSLEYINAGKLRALAVATATRSSAVPAIPTLGEFLPGYETSGFYCVVGPKRTPSEIITRLNKEINAGLVDSKIEARLADLGSTPLVLSPEGLGALIADKAERWGKVVKLAGIKAE
jgi:tripartite-type tricarboxylate transporter receptor subunit TctC